MKERITSEVRRIVESYIELVKIRSIKRTSKVLTKIAFIFIAILLILASVPFLGVALALSLGSLLSSNTLGFLLVGGLFFLLLILLFVFRNFVVKILLNFFVRIIIED